jgi:hypothetical protein
MSPDVPPPSFPSLPPGFVRVHSLSVVELPVLRLKVQNPILFIL